MARERTMAQELWGEDSLGIQMADLPTQLQNGEFLNKVELNWETVVGPREAVINNITVDNLQGTTVTPAELTVYRTIEEKAPETIELVENFFTMGGTPGSFEEPTPFGRSNRSRLRNHPRGATSNPTGWRTLSRILTSLRVD